MTRRHPTVVRPILATVATWAALGCGSRPGSDAVHGIAPEPPAEAATSIEAPPAASSAQHPAPPPSVAAISARFFQHMPMADLVPHLGTLERRVPRPTAQPPGSYFHSVYRLADGVAIVVAHSDTHMDDLYWVPASEEPLSPDGSRPHDSARHLAHSW